MKKQDPIWILDKRSKRIESHYYLVRKIVSQYNFVEKSLYQDLLQEGNIGLIKAVDRYDESYKVRFSTYACFQIKYHVQDFLRKNSSVLYIPHNKLCDAFKLKRFIEKKLKENGTPPLESQMRGFLLCTQKRLIEIISIISLINSPDNDIDTISNVPCPNSNNEIKREEVMDMLKNLEIDDQRLILDHYYSNKSLRKISRERNVSHETIRRQHNRILSQLKDSFIY